MGTDDIDQTRFGVTASFEQTALDRLQDKFDSWVSAPAKILWSDYRGKVGITIVIFYLLMGSVGVMLVEPPNQNGPFLLQPFQDWAYPLGTDGLGQGMLALMVHATPDMLMMIFAGAIFGNILGVTVGLMAGYFGGNIDKVLMTIADSVASIPGLPLLVIIAAIIEPRNPFLVGIIVNITGWAGQSRGIRSQVLPLVNEAYVEAAESIGRSSSDIMVKEILPNLLPLIFIGFLSGATGVITAAVGLYFLGLLPFTTAANWGVVLNYAYYQSGALHTAVAAHWLIVPMITITGLTFGLTLLAQAFDQVFNPRVRARHASKHQRRADPTESPESETDTTVATRSTIQQ